MRCSPVNVDDNGLRFFIERDDGAFQVNDFRCTPVDPLSLVEDHEPEFPFFSLQCIVILYIRSSEAGVPNWGTYPLSWLIAAYQHPLVIKSYTLGGAIVAHSRNKGVIVALVALSPRLKGVGFFCLSSVVDRRRNGDWLRLIASGSGGGKACHEHLHSDLS
jgi:hypothetical protein